MSFFSENRPDDIKVYMNDSWEIPPLEIDIDIGNIIYIQSSRPIKFLRLEWPYSSSDNAIILNDHWERGYGDLGWHSIKEERTYPWYMMIKDKDAVTGIGVKTCPNAFCHWMIKKDKLILISDLRAGIDGVKLEGRKLKVAELVYETYQTDTFSATRTFCEKMCDNPVLPKSPVYGCNDWYCCYGENSYDTTMLQAERLAECTENLKNRPFMVIDDGWEENYHIPHNMYDGGPWTGANKKFKDMKKTAEDIKKMDIRPGIWMRPLFSTGDESEEEILEKNFDGGVLLDPSHPLVLEKVKKDISHICDNGYELIKHDFSTYDFNGKNWGFSMKNEFIVSNRKVYDKTKTNAEILKGLYAAISDAAGKRAMLIGCNTVSHLSAGYFELQRTGDDTSGREWERTKKMGVNTLAFRMPQHYKFYSCDADCVGLTSDIPWEKTSMWLDVLSKSGTPLFVSIAKDAYGKKQKATITEAFAKSSVNTEISLPLDWETNITPKIWKSIYGTDKYEW